MNNHRWSGLIIQGAGRGWPRYRARGELADRAQARFWGQDNGNERHLPFVVRELMVDEPLAERGNPTDLKAFPLGGSHVVVNAHARDPALELSELEQDVELRRPRYSPTGLA